MSLDTYLMGVVIHEVEISPRPTNTTSRAPDSPRSSPEYPGPGIVGTLR